jgi:uncharacterized protein with GYD domain
MFFKKVKKEIARAISLAQDIKHAIQGLDHASRRMDEIQKSLLKELGFEERYQQGTMAGFIVVKKKEVE